MYMNWTYLAKGAIKMAWDVAFQDDDQGTEEHYVIKTNKIKASSSELDKNTRDALIMERAGRAPNSYESNVLTMYQYCANQHWYHSHRNKLSISISNRGDGWVRLRCIISHSGG